MPKKKTTKRKSSRSRKPIGFAKQGKSFILVFGSKKNPRAGTKKFRSKGALNKAAAKLL